LRNLAQQRAALKACPEFAEVKNGIQVIWERRGRRMVLLPKFHPELNPIERCWSWIRWWVNQRNDGTVITLSSNLQRAWRNMDALSISKYWRKARDYAAAYRDGVKSGLIEKVLKERKRHRGVDDREAFE
jgi:hypothetical protein